MNIMIKSTGNHFTKNTIIGIKKIMMKKLQIYLIVFILLPFFGCVKTLNEDLKAKETKLVLNSLMNPDSSLKINLSRTFNVFDDESSNNLPFVNQAKVSLFENNNYLFDLISEGNGYYSKPDFFPLPFTQYKVKASADTYKTIEAQVQIPNKVQIISFDTSSLIHNDEYDGMYTQNIGKISYKDPTEESNYYQLTCQILAPFGPDGEKKWQKHGIYVEENNDILFDNSYGSLLWNDKYTNGRHVEFRFGYYDVYTYMERKQTLVEDTLQFVFSLQSVDKDYYIYLKTISLYEETSGGSDPFMEPVVIHSNVENGYGILGGFQQDTVSSSLIINREDGGVK